MIQFEKLRIQGFKSFVDRTELDIAPGLNGVVGPNGCGKSNLVESLRWVMGETSAKRMRGGGMEDVIFAGTDKRAARNIAEVSLLLDNSTRTAPAAYNNSDEIEITRRIERDRGSNYKVNGKTVRARDVQMLFADTVTGANSPALVSQGRVTEIINAKPQDRRLILEESAGISGLFARRHEAELRLRAADNNLARIEDLVGSMEGRFNTLKRQARQAARYRNINSQIRQMELLIAYLELCDLQEKQRRIKEEFANSESTTAEKLAAVSQLTKTQTTQSEELAPLRQQEAEAAAALQVQKIALQRLDDEAERLKLALAETQEQLAQTTHDFAHEKQSLTESASALERMQSEHETLVEEEKNASGALEAKKKAADELEAKVEKLESEYNTLIQGEAEKKARKQSLEQQIEQNTARLETIKERHNKAKADLQELLETDKNTAPIQALETEIKTLEDKSESLSGDISKEHKAYDALSGDIETARKALTDAQTKSSEYSAEIAMLESFFDSMEDEFTPILDTVSAQAGFEKALSRALGDSLMASLDDDAPTLWRKRKSLSSMPELPAGIQPLLPHVEAPEELHLALSQIGYITDETNADDLAQNLSVGQSIVSENGSYWRWDGYTVKAEAADRHSVHLEQKNKLAELEQQKPSIESAKEAAEQNLQTLITKQEQHQESRTQNQNTLRDTDQQLTQKRSELSTLREANARFDSEKNHLEEAITTGDDDIKTLNEVISWDQDRLNKLNENEENDQTEQSGTMRILLSDAREALQNALRSFDIAQQKQNSRAARLRAIADERVNLKNRSIRSRDRLESLETRQKSLQEKLEEYQQQPRDFSEKREDLLNKISELENSREQAANRLAECETELYETNKGLKDAQEDLSQSREKRAGAQATLAGLQEQMQHMEAAIVEKFDLQPIELKANLNIDPETADDLNSLRAQKDKLLRERDAIGPVNLRAEEEAKELEEELGGMLNERQDLTQAIEELRGAIQKINKEARERLIVAFEHVNAHFQRLFVRVFGGGKAHLALIDSDDPLGAGLEIFAQPPGKSLQSLSLLSGGEQTMASIALIFAMFLTNPSPICVLDEIDAPLDDANVDRVCDLLEEIAERGETRFLVITHHRLTMARMDRLYGVTMGEKGVSQLVSVDLQQSFEFLDEAA